MAVVEVTPGAASKALELLASSEQPRGALRVRVKDGGCSGMRYELLFDEECAADDDQSEQHGLRVVVDAESAGFLEGTRIDFVESLNDGGFKIENPTAEQTCGCGESFST